MNPSKQQRNAKHYDEAAILRIIEPFLMLEGPLLVMLHALQREFGYISHEAEARLASVLNITRADVHGVVSFYHDFRRQPAGRHVLKLCRAEACQSMGGETNARSLLKALGLEWGGTTPDGRITVEAIYCLGLCATSPSAMLDGEPYGRLTLGELETLVAEIA